MIHTDATFFIAQALGLRSDIAYWLAAYTEVLDVSQYIPFDRCGVEIADTRWHSVRFNGWSRTSALTGGIAYHYGTFFMPEGGNTDGLSGLNPQRFYGGPYSTYDPVYEGLLYHFQNWAYNNGPVCTDGLTEPNPSDGNYYTGDICYQVDPSFSSFLIQGQAPLFYGVNVPYNSYQGNQIAQIDQTEEGDPFCTNAHYAKPGISDVCNQTPIPDLEAMVASSTGRLQDGSTVPVEVVRMGLYLHMLHDRASHYQCGDESYVSGPDENGVFYFLYDDKCTTGWHIIEHSLEIGKPTLAAQTYMSLDYVYDELKGWSDTVRSGHPDWFVSGRRTISKEDLIGTMSTNEYGESSYSPGTLTQALIPSSARQRLEAMNAAIQASGYDLMPGNTSDVRCIGVQ